MAGKGRRERERERERCENNIKIIKILGYKARVIV